MRYKEGLKDLSVQMNPYEEKNGEPNFRINPFLTKEGNGRAKTNAYIEGGSEDVGMDIFERGLCLPNDNKMTADEQDQIIEIIKSCFE